MISQLITANVLTSDSAEYVYYGIAVFGTFLFLGFLVFSMLGAEAGSDIDADGGIEIETHSEVGDALLKLFSIKALTAFLMFFGWSAVLFGETLTGLLISIGIGTGMMVLTSLLIHLMLKLQDGGSHRDGYIGKTGTVYLSLPAERKNHGIITVVTAEGSRELHAVADAEIVTGNQVTIIEKLDASLYLVQQV